MTTKTFDRETLLDLTVNFVPLFIILFFVGAFLVFAPWGRGGLATVLQYLLLLVPFAALAYLTYISGKAIAGSEKTGTVYPHGKALVEGAEPTHEPAETTDEDAAAESPAAESVTDE